MSGRTISQVYSTGITLTNGTENPVAVLGSGTIAVAGAGSVALQSTASIYWSIDNAGLVGGYRAGVSLAGGGSLVNTGRISASQTAGPGYSYDSSTSRFTPISGGVVMAGGGISNANSGTIDGYFEAVALGGGGSVTNAGYIRGGAKYFGVVLPASGSVSNAATGTISAGRVSVLAFGGASTVANAGLISAPTAFGVFLIGGGSVSNAGSAVIRGGSDGVVATRNLSTLTNQGTIAGSKFSGAVFAAGGYVSNAGSGTITGEYFGVRITNIAGSVNNQGSVASFAAYVGQSTFDAAGIAVSAGGTVTNGPAGDVRATWKGVEVGNVSASVGGTVLNQGTIYASNSNGHTGAAVWIHGPGLISNASSGTIAGGPFAIVAYDRTTVVNSGSIGGSEFAFDAAKPGFAELVVDEPGARFSGTVTGGDAPGSTVVSTLELAAGLSQGSIGGLGTQFVDFGQITVDPGASWALGGSNSVAAGITLTDQGTLTLGAGASLTQTVAGVVSGAGATLAVDGAGASWTDTGGAVIGNTATGALAISNQASVVVGAAASAYALVLGVGTAGAGSLDVSAAAATAFGGLTVGQSGSGHLRVENQATLQTGGSTADPSLGVEIAQGAGGPSDAAVTGSKTLLTNTGRFVVGDQGFGSLLIGSGGTVVTTPGTVAGLAGAMIGAAAGSDGSDVSVTGNGSGWRITGSLVVGQAATGLLAITAGGTVSADQAILGASAAGSGIVSVDGTGSALTLTGGLDVGDASSSELSILNGATVSAQNADIGMLSGASGDVDIEGAGSRLDLASNLQVGDAGVGVLTLGNGTTLHVVGNLIIGANGVLSQFGGAIDPSVVNNAGRAGGSGPITADVSIVNSGTLFAASGTEALSAPIITGTGMLEIGGKGDLAVNVGSVVATQTVSFADGTGVLTVGTLGGFSAVIGDVIAGDSIVVQGTSIASLSFDASTHVLTLFDPSHARAGVLQFGASVTDQSLISVNGLTPCFVAGTRIGTVRGELPVEALRVGDLVRVVVTAPSLRGRAEPVIWLGHRTIDCTRHPEPHKVWPVRVLAHAFGSGRPSRDLWLSPDHAIYVHGVLIPVKRLINGTSIAQVARDSVTYFHVELTRHAVLLAEGLPAESYLDTGDRKNFANGGGPTALHPDFASRARDAQACAPLIVAGPELDAARRRIDAIARVRAAPTDTRPASARAG